MRPVRVTGTVGLCCLALVCGPALALPDLERGLAALERGDVEQARADLAPLAEHGYVKAQIGLARLYAAEPSAQARQHAETWLRRAVEQDPSVRLELARLLLADAPRTDPMEVDRLLTAVAGERGEDAVLRLRVRLYREYPQRFKTDEAAEFAAQAAASDQPDLRAEALSWYRVHAGQAQYSEALAQLCRRDLDVQPECHADLARHARRIGDAEQYRATLQVVQSKAAAGELKADTIGRVARVAVAEDLPGSTDPSVAYALFAHIEQPSSDTQVRVAKLLLDDPALDPDADPVAVLAQAMEQGSDEAAMVLGRHYLSARNPQADPARAEALLREAAATQPAAHYYLGRIFERGYRGRVQPDLALRHYLGAARGGYIWADMALARMFWNNRGVRVDPVNACTFALLAENNGVSEAAELLQTLRGEMSPAQLEAAEGLAQREYRARQAADTTTQLATRGQP